MPPKAGTREIEMNKIEKLDSRLRGTDAFFMIATQPARGGKGGGDVFDCGYGAL